MLTMPGALDKLRAEWEPCWEQALEIWSRFTKLKDPTWCFSSADEKRESLSGSFAMIRLVDQAVVVSLSQVREMGLEPYALQILAHEIGHHVYCPANLSDHARMIARMRHALPTKETFAPFAANLYADLLINDRLQRSAGLDMAAVYRALNAQSMNKSERASATWALYMRTYEILWSIQKGHLGGGSGNRRLEGDAQLGARLIRSYSREWLDGSGRFAALLLPYLLEDDNISVEKFLRGWMDTKGAGVGSSGVPAGLTGVDAGELEGAIHPSLDPELSGIDAPPTENQAPPQEMEQKQSGGQFREPFEFGEILRSLGMPVNDHDAALAYYRERAVPHLVRFPTQEIEQSTEPLAEGFELWDIGSPLEDVDWLQTILVSPQPVPGVTTVQNTWGIMSGGLPEFEAVDLDLYVDCSGSMPNPQQQVSHITLAGAIVALSAIRVGARVQATLWSGARQFETTGGFVSDATRVLRILTGYLGGGTAFPIHLLRDTYQHRTPRDRPVHILVLSDDGVDTMFATDEKANDGKDVARMTLEKARGGGTLALNLFRDASQIPDLVFAQALGFNVYRVTSWEELIDFARAFSKAAYEKLPRKQQLR
jgi:hypothetical protein